MSDVLPHVTNANFATKTSTTSELLSSSSPSSSSVRFDPYESATQVSPDLNETTLNVCSETRTVGRRATTTTESSVAKQDTATANDTNEQFRQDEIVPITDKKNAWNKENTKSATTKKSHNKSNNERNQEFNAPNDKDLIPHCSPFDISRPAVESGTFSEGAKMVLESSVMRVGSVHADVDGNDHDLLKPTSSSNLMAMTTTKESTNSSIPNDNLQRPSIESTKETTMKNDDAVATAGNGASFSPTEKDKRDDVSDSKPLHQRKPVVIVHNPYKKRKLVEIGDKKSNFATTTVDDAENAAVAAAAAVIKKEEAIIASVRENERKRREARPRKVTIDDPAYACLVCGLTLDRISSGVSGKLKHIKRCARKHIKRCARKHGVSLQDLKAKNGSDVCSALDRNKNDGSVENGTHSDRGDAEVDVGNRGSASDTLKTDDNQQEDETANLGDVVDLISLDGSCDDSNKMNEEDSATHASISTANSTFVRSLGEISEKSSASITAKKQQSVLSNYFRVPVRSINNVLMQGAKELAANTDKSRRKQSESVNTTKTASTKAPRRSYGRRNGNYSRTTTAPCPSFKRIPHTDIICDGFRYARPGLSKNYFLTHFHSDHYGGIDSKWNFGTIHCSRTTANLVHMQLGVSWEYLKVLPMETTVAVAEGVKVTLLDANHCPGATMFLFEVGASYTILHVGDFRWDRDRMLEGVQKRLGSANRGGGRLDELFLDTTYCDPKYDLPTQDEAVRAATEAVRAEMELDDRSGGNTLFLFGAYFIGKERIYTAVAERFGLRVYVEPRRLRTIKAYEGWSADRVRRLFTTVRSESRLWVVPIGHVNIKKITEHYLTASNRTKALSKGFTRVVGFRPTGWTFQGKRGGNKKNSNNNVNNSIATRRSNRANSCVVYGVPYSEHSSFPELVDCLACLNPRKIVPTVSVSKSEEQRRMLLEAVNRI